MAAKSWDRPLEKTFCPMSGRKVGGKVVPNHLMEVKHLTRGRVMFKCSTHSVRTILNQGQVPAPHTFALAPGDKIVWAEEPAHDPVNRPAHYTDGKIEVIDYIIDRGWGEGFCLGNAVKYISRAGKKDPTKTVEDLEKARWYLDRWISHLKKEGGTA